MKETVVSSVVSSDSS